MSVAGFALLFVAAVCMAMANLKMKIGIARENLLAQKLVGLCVIIAGITIVSMG